ncbi:MAG: hypothetical protein ACREQM_05640, partial [Candidatus Dormibacteraceae bacterium]
MLEILGTAPLVLDANPISSPVAWLVGAAGKYIGSLHILRYVLDPMQLLIPIDHPHDPMAALGADPLGRVVPSCGGRSGCNFQSIATSVKGIGYVLFAIVLLARMLKLAAQGQFRSPEHILFDLVPRLLLGLLAIQFVDRLLNDAGELSMAGGFLLEDAMLLPIRIENATDLLSAFHAGGGLGVITLPVLYLLVAYLLLLVVTSRLALLLGALVAPLAIPLAIYSGSGRLAGIWTRMVVSSLLIPVVTGVGMAGSMALAWLVDRVTGQIPFFGSYLGGVTGECGLLFTAIAATLLFKDAVKQGMSATRGSFESAHLGQVAGAPGEVAGMMRRGLEVGAGVGRFTAGDPTGAMQALKGLRGGQPGGSPTGPGPSTAGPAAAVLDEIMPGSSELLQPPEVGDITGAAGASFERRVGGGVATYTIRRRSQIRWAEFLAEPPDDG